MKNNTLGKIAVATASRAKTLKNKSSDLHTTMDFGSVICGKLQRCIPGTTINVGTKERVLLTSLVAPCFGRMNLKAYHQFVPFSDLWENMPAMMAQEAIYRNGQSFTPLHVPCVPLNQLSLMVLFGAQMTVYTYDSTHLKLPQIPASNNWSDSVSSLPSNIQTIINDLGIVFNYNSFGLSNSARIGIWYLISGIANTAALPLSNPTFSSFFDYSTDHPNDLEGFGKTYVSPEGADYLIPVTIPASGTDPARYYLLAFRLSSFGRRLRKNLIGCGWEFNLDSDAPFSLLPIFAFYKAYYDVFGLTLYSNWEETYASKILSWCNNQPSPLINLWNPTSDSQSYDLRCFFVYEFGATFFTDEQDFVSSQIRKTAVSPSYSGFISSIDTDVSATNVPANPNMTAPSNPSVEPGSLGYPNNHVFINNTVHGQLDSKLLQKLYRQTNVNTIAGRRIAELLRAQGLGAYVDECKSNFIGSWSLDLNVYDLPSQSDTYQNAHDGMRLGEFGAFGKSSGQHPLVRYETSEDGYFITLLVVVPKGGYAEVIDPDALCVDKWSQYNPEFDSLGYQFFKKMTSVQGSQPWANMALNDGSLSASFGLGPRYFDKKFGRNVINGDFSLRSTRHSYQPFCLERLIEVGEHKVGAADTTTSPGATLYPFESVEYLNPARLPIAGNVWRFPTRYEWISRFRRIFYNDSSSIDAYQSFGVSFGSTAAYEFFSLFDDNFICHIVFELNVYDQMLPVQDSYETSDDENHADTSLSKA